MFDSIKQIKTLRTRIYALERVEHNFISANSEIKLQTHPRKLYFINPEKKLEILYDAERSKKATVKPHIFPYLTVHLDPNGNLMRKNQHYTIHELGFEFIAKTIALTLKSNQAQPRNFEYIGRVEKNGYHCHLLQFEEDNFTYQDYVVQEKETATSIAYKLCVNDYLLRYKNDLLNDFGYLKKGRVLRVPNLFCKKAVLYIDEQHLLPVAISLFDDKGLFESYGFSATVVNRTFDKNEFSSSNPAYGF